jgi:hypothetical protein
MTAINAKAVHRMHVPGQAQQWSPESKKSRHNTDSKRERTREAACLNGSDQHHDYEAARSGRWNQRDQSDLRPRRRLHGGHNDVRDNAV